ncbi:hypothetical protein BS50DRAFT_589325 [Corynespora cassiicola Philippines]|uniref:Uncharacterized protein n=1 Tax=Corynespora cassiicola Philippines TaxID=1448308 RepID=A0A2T2NHL4_CORCC|nr:hypothetical protein BS50DRAFT_589325 [Corynespora cassiicola Philippines]
MDHNPGRQAHLLKIPREVRDEIYHELWLQISHIQAKYNGLVFSVWYNRDVKRDIERDLQASTPSWVMTSHQILCESVEQLQRRSTWVFRQSFCDHEFNDFFRRYQMFDPLPSDFGSRHFAWFKKIGKTPYTCFNEHTSAMKMLPNWNEGNKLLYPAGGRTLFLDSPCIMNITIKGRFGDRHGEIIRWGIGSRLLSRVLKAIFSRTPLSAPKIRNLKLSIGCFNYDSWNNDVVDNLSVMEDLARGLRLEVLAIQGIESHRAKRQSLLWEKIIPQLSSTS